MLKSSAALTRRQEKFWHAYLETGDAFASYLRAYHVKDGTPREATETYVAKVMAKASVQARIAELKENPQAAVKIADKPKKAKPVTADAQNGRARSEPTTAKPKKSPVTFTVELGHRICEEIALRRSLAEICAEPGFPSERTVYQWRRTHQEFAAEYEEARKWRAEARADFVTMRC